jgi:apolipoprotein N-acyltransferase
VSAAEAPLNSEYHLYLNLMAFGHLVGAAFVALLIVLFADFPWAGGGLSAALVLFILVEHRKRLMSQRHRFRLTFHTIFSTAFLGLWLYFMLRPGFIPALAMVPVLCSAYEYALERTSGETAAN